MKKRLLILLSVILLFISLGGVLLSPSKSTDGQVVAADKEIINNKPDDPKPNENIQSEWLDIKRLGPKQGVIMKDQPQIPHSYGDAERLYYSRPFDIHTGWSLQLYECQRYISHYDPIYQNGVVVEWRPRYESTWFDLGMPIETDDKHAPGMLSDYVEQLQTLYGDMGRGIDWTSARGELWGVDYWPIYTYNSKGDFAAGACQTGDRAYFYNNNEILMEGRVQVETQDPGEESKEAPSRTEGEAKGKAFWELRRFDDSKPSGIYLESSFEIAGDHYATRNSKHKVSVEGKTVEQREAITMDIPEALPLKGKSFTYEFSYEYTNFYRDIYECVDSEDGYCYDWRFKERIPDWDKVKTFTLSDSIKMDHSQQDTVKANTMDEVLAKKWVVGRQDTYSPSKKSKVYHEKYSRAEGNKWKNEVKLKTQTTLPMTPGKLLYSVELPSKAHKDGNFYPLLKKQSSGTFKAAELDESLQAEFAEGVQLQQKVMDDKGTSGEQRQFEGEFVSDLFFTTSGTGFMSGYPYAELVKESIVNGQSMPDFDKVVKEGTQKGEREFVTFTDGVPFKDDWVFTESEEDLEKLQRYALPITPYSELHPNETYKNNLELLDMGLSDLRFLFDQTFSFEHYLFGSGYDEAWIIEQPESRFPVTEYETVEMTPEQVQALKEADREHSNNKIHNFRFVDRTFPDKVKEILGR